MKSSYVLRLTYMSLKYFVLIASMVKIVKIARKNYLEKICFDAAAESISERKRRRDCPDP